MGESPRKRGGAHGHTECFAALYTNGGGGGVWWKEDGAPGGLGSSRAER
jgi:hypothetical protein